MCVCQLLNEASAPSERARERERERGTRARRNTNNDFNMTTASIKAVYNLLKERNAPMSVQLLVDNLQTQKIKKSQVEKSLDNLVADSKVTRKEYGKTKIFFLSQEKLEKATPEELASLGSKAKELKGTIESEKQQLGAIKKEVAKLKTNLTETQMKDRIKELEKQISEKKSKLKHFDSKSGTVSKETFCETKLHLQQNLVLWKKHKTTFKNLWDTVLESMETIKESKLRDEACIETDECVGVKYSHFNDLVKKRKAGAR